MNENKSTIGPHSRRKSKIFWLEVRIAVVAGVILLVITAIPFAFIGKKIISIITGPPPGPPVGTIVAWHRDLATEAIPLPDGWIECNGQRVSDAASPFNGKLVPKLNAEKRFLRGGDKSGELEDATHVSVVVETNADTLFFNQSGINATTINSDFEDNPDRLGPGQRGAIRKTGSDGLGAGQIYGGRVRPTNMSVVWLIRVK